MTRDVLTLFVRRILRTLLVHSPVTTSVGASFGLFAHQLATSIGRSDGFQFSPGNALVWMLGGAALLNLRSALRRVQLPQDVEVALALIDRAKRDGVPRAHVTAMYRDLFERVRQQLLVSAELNSPVTDIPEAERAKHL
jgi:hypothetical protein